MCNAEEQETLGKYQSNFGTSRGFFCLFDCLFVCFFLALTAMRVRHRGEGQILL